jgi:hypothetical protein
VSILGGFIGQLAMVFNTVAKHYARLDIPTKSRASQSAKSKQGTPSRPQTESSQKELKADPSQASIPAAEKEPEVPKENPHQILHPKVVQKFLYEYIETKLKTERLSIQIDPMIEHFMKTGLRVPLELNQIRTMKEPNYSEFRELLRQKSGGYALNLIREHQDELHLEPGVFDLAFESFWDMYCLKH